MYLAQMVIIGCIYFFSAGVLGQTIVEPLCQRSKVKYTVQEKHFELNVDICKNSLSQYYAKKCVDGCEFKTALEKTGAIEIKDSVLGSPGGQICKKLGLNSFLTEIDFKGERAENVEFCFGKHPTAFVSTGFLSQLNWNLVNVQKVEKNDK